MLTPADYRNLADGAFVMAQKYRDMAEGDTNQPRREHLLKLADLRDDDAVFYLERSSLVEQYEIMRATKEAAQ